MKKLSIFLFALGAALSLSAEGLPDQYAPWGKLIITDFANAPFPHSKRAQGHRFRDKDYSAAEHYSDSHVAVFIPKNFRAIDKIDFVVYFHGWRNNLNGVLVKNALMEQLVKSERNAILIVPQGPLDAPDSCGGKLEDPEGFARFMEEAMDILQKDGLFTKAKIGKIIISGHSGAFQVMSSILAGGGLTDHIKEVWLFDALYARADRFGAWQTQSHGRMLAIYTARGGTKPQTDALMANLKKNGVSFCAGEEGKMTVGDLMKQCPIFILSRQGFAQLTQANDMFCKFLETSVLSHTRKGYSIPSPRAK